MINYISTADVVEIITILDDHEPHNLSLVSEHGLSFLLKVESNSYKKNILFDTGLSHNAATINMSRLNLSPNDLDMIVLSHSHRDHSTGVLSILNEINNNIPVICHSSIFRTNIAVDPVLRYTGIIHSKNDIMNFGGNLVLIDEPLTLMEGVVYSGEINQISDFENKTSKYFNISQGKKYEDKLLDEVCLAINLKNKGLVIVTACSHPGIINIINHCINVTGINNIYALIGGLHLLNSNSLFIDKTISELSKFNIKYIDIGHCTGNCAIDKFKTAFADRCHLLYTGKKIKL